MSGKHGFYQKPYSDKDIINTMCQALSQAKPTPQGDCKTLVFSSKTLAETCSAHTMAIKLFRGPQTIREANARFQQNPAPGSHVFNLRNERFNEVQTKYEELQRRIAEEKDASQEQEVAIGPGIDG